MLLLMIALIKIIISIYPRLSYQPKTIVALNMMVTVKIF